MSVKDGESYLRAAISSILAQTFSNFELIIIDDGSKDRTADIIHEFSDARIISLSNLYSLGLSKSLNIGLEKACGMYIARMDADDVSLPNRLELQTNYLDAHPDVAVLGTGFSFIDANGRVIQDYQFPLTHELIAWSLPFYNPIAHSSVMMRASVIKDLGAYSPELRRSQDYDLWWRVSFQARLANLADLLVLLRQHDAQVSREYGTDQLAHGIQINSRHFSEVMHQKIPAGLIEKMWTGKASSLEEAVCIGNLIWKWYRINIPRVQSPTTKLYIVNDALKRIDMVIAPFSRHPRALPLTFKLYLLRRTGKEFA